MVRQAHHERCRKVACPLILFCLVGLTSCGRVVEPSQGPVPLAAERYKDEKAQVHLQWLGVSSWILSRGPDVVVLDPFFSRPSLSEVALGGFGMRNRYEPERIRAVLPALPQDTDFLLIGHGHYDHLMDVPYYLANPSRITYVGSRTAYNILQGFHPPQPFEFRVGDDSQQLGHAIAHDGSQVRVTPFLADHAPHWQNLMLMAGHVDTPLSAEPRTVWDYKLGNTLVFFVDFLGAHDDIVFRVFVNGAASTPLAMRSIPPEFLADRPVDVAILCVPGWSWVQDYPESILGTLKPQHVVLSHYDDFFRPFQYGEDPQTDMQFVMMARYSAFLEKLEQSARTLPVKASIHQPKTGEALCFQPGAGRC